MLGNLEARRDWGWAPDYTDAMVRAMRQALAEDYVVATGESHSVGDFAMAAPKRAGIADGADRIRVDETFARPSDAKILLGDESPARTLSVGRRR